MPYPNLPQVACLLSVTFAAMTFIPDAEAQPANPPRTKEKKMKSIFIGNVGVLTRGINATYSPRRNPRSSLFY